MRIAITSYFLPVIAAASLPAYAQAPDYVLFSEYSTKSESIDDSGSSSSSGHTSIAERIVSSDAEGVVIEYSMLGDPSEIRGNAIWMFPALVSIAPDGSKTLQNPDEIKTRVDEWLVDTGWSREICSSYFFTWTAQQVLCEPEAVIEEIEAYGMRPGTISTGAIIHLPHHGVSITLREAGSSEGYTRFEGTAAVDPVFVREAAIKTDLAVAEMSGQALSLAEATAQNAKLDASGTITIEVTVDSQGLVWKRVETVNAVVKSHRFGDERRESNAVVSRLHYSEWEDVR